MIPTSRNSEIISQDGSSKTHHVYTAQKFYKNENSEYNKVDLSMADASSNIGDISLSNKRVMSLGIRKDSNPEKFLGIRPDQTQSIGTNQLEFTIKKVIYDGVEQPIDLSKNEDIGDDRMDLGSLIVESTIHRVTQMSKHDGSHKDFIIEYELHLTGMSVTNNKYSSDYTFREPVSFSSIDIGEGNLDYIWNYHKNNPLSDTDDKSITLMIGKFTGESILLGDKDRDEEFNDSSLSGYNTIDIGMTGSSVYLKNAIALCFSFQNIEEELYKIAINNTCEALNLTPLVDTEYPENTGQYLSDSNGNKVAGCHMGEDVSRFYIFINTEAIPDSIKSLFKLKTFNNTGYLNTAMSDVKTSLDSQFSYNMNSVALNADYYEPNSEGVFIINTGTDLEYEISIPRAFDSEFKQIGISTFHSLKHESGDIYKYTKYLTTDGYLSRKLKDVRYIDGTTNLDNDCDATHYKTLALTQAQVRTAGNPLFLGLDYANYIQFARSYRASFINSMRWNSITMGYKWDTSSITDTVTSVIFKLYAAGNTSANQDTLPVKSVITGSHFVFQDWLKLDGLSGTTYMNSSFASWATIYDNASSWTSSWGTSTAYDWRSLTLNSTAQTDIEDDDIFQFTMLEDDCFTNTGFGTNTNVNQNRSRGNTHLSGAYAPYLVIVTEEGEEAVTYNATFFGANF